MICQTTKTKFALLVMMMMAIYAYVYPSPHIRSYCCHTYGDDDYDDGDDEDMCVWCQQSKQHASLVAVSRAKRGLFKRGGGVAKGWTMIRHCFGWTGKQTPTATPTKPMATGMTMIIKYLLLIKVNFAIQWNRLRDSQTTKLWNHQPPPPTTKNTTYICMYVHIPPKIHTHVCTYVNMSIIFKIEMSKC